MSDFDFYLDKIGEIGLVDQVRHSLVYASGIPKVHLHEVVIFENGSLGQVFSIEEDQVEILILSGQQISAGSKLTRTGDFLKVSVGDGLLGRMVNPLGIPIDGKGAIKNLSQSRVDIEPLKLEQRKDVVEPFETGVTLVDLIIPLGKGQRELVVGDRKTGKTEFLVQTIFTQAALNTVCIYCVIGQRLTDTQKLYEFFAKAGVMDRISIIASSSSDTSGMVFITPYTAMTAAEAFRDQGKNVLLILDDLTTHARTYREISLLAKRFPGRSSYPGDIFYIHAKLIERAGNFKKGSITCLPQAESIMGDLSGYIQTNLMAMTDGHIFFDIDLYNQGKRPAINPFLSVTRVGHQTQTPIKRDASGQLSNFLVNYEKMKQFMHFGAEVGEEARKTLAQGQLVDIFFTQGANKSYALNANILVLAGIWAGTWEDTKPDDFRREIEQVILSYETDDVYKKQIDEKITKANNFTEFVQVIKLQPDIITSKIIKNYQK